MTNCFALLDQPQRPWIDEDELQKVYHAKTLRLHPDSVRSFAAGEVASFPTFSELNDAYRTLRDPALRLQHLLRLHDAGSESDNSVPPQLQELFPAISSAVARGSSLLGKISGSQTALSRSLLTAQLLDTRNEVERLRATLTRLHDATMADLRALDGEWDTASPEALERARRLHRVLTYISRWRAQLDELQFGLGS